MGGLRLGKKIGCRAILDDPALVQNDGALAQTTDDAEVVADEGKRQAKLAHQPLQQVQDLGL